MKRRNSERKAILKIILSCLMTIILMLPSVKVKAECDEPLALPVLTKGSALDNLLAVALSQEGYSEAEDGSAYYSEWLGQSGRAWCSEFVAWSAYKAGIYTDLIPSATSVKKFRSFFSERDSFYMVKNGACKGCECHLYSDKYITLNEIQPGDIAFIETNDDASTGDDHTALVVSVSDEYVYTIEGNTSDQVKQRKRAVNKIHGICRPDYSLADYSEVNVKKTKITSVSKGKNDIVSWKAVSGAEGYLVYRAASKNGEYKLVKTVNGAKSKSCKISNGKGKKYYYKVAGFACYRDVIYRSSFSNIMSNK